ncbi:MAG TPA: hypothetical protein VFV49_09435 [Thermoanaerobaculia bacterium]|nr:hypothetical protein [Thermoanaerobaculia bacterium]
MKRHACLLIAVFALFHSHCLAARKSVPGKPVIRPGEPFDVPLTVSGTKERVRVRVLNLTPHIVSVIGGDEQFVVSSGGEKNVLTMHVVGGSQGHSSFAMEIDHTEPDGVFRRELRRVAEETRKRADALEPIRLPTGRDVYRLEDVVNVLQKADDDLRNVLFEPTWAAFRDALHDYVTSLIRRANEEASDVPESSLAGSSRAVVVSYRLVAKKRVVAKERAWSLFTDLSNLLFDTAEKRSNREICVQTIPPGFAITLSPRSYAPDALTVTTPSLVTIKVGVHKYQIAARDTSIASSGELDFLRNPRVTIECPVKIKKSDPEACRFREEAASPCPPR